MEAARERIYNPVQKDFATFLKTSDETRGEMSLFQVELAPGGGNPLHAHSAFTEEFKVLEGELNVQVGKQHLVLKPGQKALVPRNTNHRFYSTSNTPTVFLVELRPGHKGFEQALRIVYNMAGVRLAPVKHLLALGLLVEMSGTTPVGAASLLKPVLGLLASIARRRGLDKALEAEFVYRR
jgi:quercetin dioxygenase-like cupin family protein